MRKIVIILVVAVFIIGCLGSENEKKQVVTFSDQNLENHIRTLIKKQEGDIITSDLSEITDLDINSLYIKSLVGLEYFYNLKILNASYNQIKNVPDLSNTKLFQVFLDYNQMERFPKLPISLKYLSLSSNENLTNIEEIETLINLEELDISTTSTTNIKFLSKLTKLEKLLLKHNKIEDLSPLSNLNLKVFHFYSPVESINLDPLKDIITLEKLGIPINNIENYKFLENLTNLSYLSLSKTSISDLSVLKDHTKLEILYLSDTNISDISIIKNNFNLVYLSFDNTKVEDISELSNFELLRELHMSDTNISDLTPIKDLPLILLSVSGENLDLSIGSDNLKILQDFEAKGCKVNYKHPN